jgi:hypothetical protein
MADGRRALAAKREVERVTDISDANEAWGFSPSRAG